jgi:hypothetical protein
MGRFQNCFRYLRLCTLLITALFTFASAAAALEAGFQIPEPNPPAAVQPETVAETPRGLSRQAAPDTEWTFHKSSDNQHPSGIEQQMLWLINRARTDPTREGLWLAELDDPDVAGARSYFNVNLDLLRAEFAAIPAKPPAAFDVRLYQAARAHSDYLIATETQSHDGQLDRVPAAGFFSRAIRGNVFSYTRSGIHGHAGFNIDWGGSDGSGMQPGRGHRQAIMSMDGDYTNVGLAVEETTSTIVGPLVTTGNFCNAISSQPDHFNRFLVGTVWQDLNANDQYDAGEGSGGVEVRPDQGDYYAVTGDSGGYAVPIGQSGTYTVTFSGPGVESGTTRTVVVGSQSVLLDLLYSGGSPGGAEAVTGSAAAISQSSAQLSGIVNANGFDVDYYFEYGPTTQYGEISELFSTTANGSIQIVISDLSGGTLYHYRLAVVTDTTTVYGSDRSFESLSATAQPGLSPSGSGGGGGGCFIRALGQ